MRRSYTVDISGDAEERFHIGIVRLRFQWIREEDHKVNLTFGDSGPDLLVTSQRPTF